MLFLLGLHHLHNSYAQLKLHTISKKSLKGSKFNKPMVQPFPISDEV